MSYRPTSLDFINRPNPVEPHTDPHKHPLHTDQSHLRLLHDTNTGAAISAGEPPRKRRKSQDGNRHDVSRPTLPAVRQQNEKRLRIPPTLSGLHQPPPDSGILPSISVNGLRSVELPERTAPPTQQSEATAVTARQDHVQLPKKGDTTAATGQAEEGQVSATAETKSSGKANKPRKNKKWTASETQCLLKGVEKHGIGSWTKILKDSDLDFDERRSALDLKDRFRVCCPDQYQATKDGQNSSRSQDANNDFPAKISNSKAKRSRATHRKTHTELQDLGINAGFTQSTRRKRTAYSEEEDLALLRGFQKYGQKWSQIQQDETLGLDARTATDLRDRMRNRWPEEYVKAGLKLKRNPRGGDLDEGQVRVDDTAVRAFGNDVKGTPSTMAKARAAAVLEQPASSSKDKEHETTSAAPSILSSRKITASFLTQPDDDVFWGLPLDSTSIADDERITLDRRILDWPVDSGRIAVDKSSNNIDPLATLNLPRPTIPSGSTTVSSAVPTAASLPSLAPVTAGPMATFDFGEQLELPSLLAGFGALEEDGSGAGDGRGGVGALGMPSLEEILG